MIKARGGDFYFFNAKLGLRYLLSGVDYSRLLEYPITVENLMVEAGLRVLDIGSGGSILPTFLLSKGCIVYSTDIDENFIKIQTQYIQRLKLEHLVNIGRFKIEIQDARNLSYPEQSFDRVTAISSLEHISGEGDCRAMREIARVLVPGGRAVITVPCDNYYVEKKYGPDRDYLYERWYDPTAIRKRLIEPSGLVVKKIEYFNDKGFEFNKFWWRLNPRIRMLYQGALIIPSIVFQRRTDEKSLEDALVAILTLEKA